MYRPYFNFISTDWSDASRVNDLLNVRFIVARGPRKLRVLFRDPRLGVMVYERAHWLPRAFFLRELGTDGRRIEALHEFRLLHYDDVRQTYQVTARTPDEVIFSEVWYPGWRAYVDGNRVPMLRVSLPGFPALLRGVRVPRGTHRIESVYLAGL
jgi:hypothetical protein